MIPLSPPDVDPDEARRRMLEELSKSEYDDSPGFVTWLLGMLETWLMDVLVGIDGSSAAQAGIFVALAVLLVVVAVQMVSLGLLGELVVNMRRRRNLDATADGDLR